jgi:DNA transposition AAA+ family ATPase
LLDSIIWTAERAKKFLIVDDGHFLCWESFECIRTIHDLGGVGVAYLGQERLYDQMRGGARTGFLYDQILSRLAVRRTISHVTRDDAKQIAEGICPELDKASIDFLYSKAQGQGRFRTMVHILDLAVKEASEHGEAVDVHLLRDAAAFLMI